MKKIWIIAWLMVASLSAMAQSTYEEDYQKFKRERQKEYADFKAKANRDFAEFLKQRWKDYKAFEAHKAPLPVVLPAPEKVPTKDLRPLPDVTPDFDRLRKISERPAPIVCPRPEADRRPQPGVRPAPEQRPGGIAPRPAPEQRPGIAPRPAPRPRPGQKPSRPEQPTPDRPHREPIAEPSQPLHPERPARPETPAPVPAPIPAPSSDEEIRTMDFFGDVVEYGWTEGLNPRMKQVSEGGFSLLWSAWSKSCDGLVDRMERYATEHHLNGWGNYQLAKRISEAIYPEEQANERIAMQAFLLSQLKFHAQVALCGDRLVLLLPFHEKVYGVSYLTLDGQPYYIYSYGHNPSAGFYTYDNKFAYAEEDLSLRMDGKMQVGMELEMKFKRMSELVGEELSATMNVGQIAMLLTYPMMDGEVYYAQAIDRDLAQRILPVLKRKIAGMSETAAVNYLLNFVQSGFDYETDDKMFGRQKQLFVEESFYYGKNNCKDRVGVFSWLVRELVGLDMISISYEGNAASRGVGHITTGVAFTGAVKGDAFTYRGKRYVMCDPTYIGADIGQTMPCYRQSEAKLLPL